MVVLNNISLGISDNDSILIAGLYRKLLNELMIRPRLDSLLYTIVNALQREKGGKLRSNGLKRSSNNLQKIEKGYRGQYRLSWTSTGGNKVQRLVLTI